MKWALIGLLLLAGCAGPKVTAPPPPAINGVLFSWTGTGNPSMRACGTGVVPPCLSGYVLTDGTVIVTSPSIGTLSYLLSPSPTVGTHNYGLAVNVLNADGSTTASAKALTVVQIQ
jgi:hypothetical protein